ncbi:hypothetical protein TH53_00300 [Pedobacter lusitanus]|uniref:GLPGLI family protein n=1 Tax=Pedobacter lusitanus TaxID=1503925 RepID=A0A0D0FAW1_9SPHI|nr:hypothetical protein [Pedobacter lusitanus]KIO78968.1 hypothetical protein TH53_00300 [Pedobacter lusitanus]
MKKTMLLLALISSAVTYGKAQDKTQGKIEYDVIKNLHAGLKPDQQQLKDLIPETVTDNNEIYFNGVKAKLLAKKKDHSSKEDGISLKFQSDQDNILATYMDTGKVYKLTEEAGKKELQLDTMNFKGKEFGKAGSRTRNILGFTCREVILDGGKMGKMFIWITDELPFSGGPMGFTKGKGVILAVDSKVLKVIATAINYIPVPLSEVTIPTDVPVKLKKSN